MTHKTHMVVGTLVSIPFIASPIGLLGISGSIAPDFDIKLGIKHRTITHSLLMLFFTSLIIKNINFNIGLIWFINYLSHLILDSLTKSGVKFFYPSKKNYGLRLFKTGDIFDYIIRVVGIMLIFLIIGKLILA